MKKVQCLIVEDEPIAAEILEDYIQQLPFLELAGICSDALFAMEQLKQKDIDVLFLDIHLPKLKGLDFLKTLVHPPQVILTTAYHEYAVDAFSLGVVDYLMKPIEFSRFLMAVNKIRRQPAPASSSPNQTERLYLFFNINKKMVKVYIDEIEYIESLKDYCKIVTTSKNYVVRGQIGELETQFQAYKFVRVHRSYMVALDKIIAYSAVDIELSKKNIPIGRSYKELVHQVFEEYL